MYFTVHRPPCDLNLISHDPVDLVQVLGIIGLTPMYGYIWPSVSIVTVTVSDQSSMLTGNTSMQTVSSPSPEPEVYKLVSLSYTLHVPKCPLSYCANVSYL